MTQVNVYNEKGVEAKKLELTDAVFGIPFNNSLVHQVYLAQRANARLPWADTKDKGEVRGGGKKPWKQKGTGRARHGSIRSPIWKGGGVTFGPLTDRSYKQKINKKMNKMAVAMSLSEKVRGEEFIVIEKWTETGKTKEMAALRVALPGNGKTTLLLVSEMKPDLVKAAKNIPNCFLRRAIDVNVVDLMNHKFVITTPDAVKVIENRLS